MKQDNRLIALDIGRGLAILGVIAAHLSAWVSGLPYWLSLVAKSGQYGVQLFFVISAITICKTLSDDRRKGFDTGALIRRFYLKRFMRIAPLYYLGIVTYGVLDRVASKVIHAHVLGAHNVWDILANVLFVHEFVPTAINSVVPGGWSIGVEMAFYLVAPILIVMSGMWGYLWLATATMLCVSYGAAWLAAYHSGTDAIVNNTFLYYWPPTQFPCFALGIFLWICSKDRILNRRPNVKVALLAAFGLAIGYAALMVAGVGMNLSHAVAPIIAAGAGASMLTFLTTIPLTLKNLNIAQKLGERSYGVYIWHFIGIFIFRIILKMGNTELSGISPILIFVTGMIFIPILAYNLSRVTEHFIEKPASRWSKERFLRNSPQTSRGENKLTIISAGD